MRRPPVSSRSGMALVVTMAFVVLIVILVVGLSSAVLIDRPTANSYFERLRAGEFARMGVDTVVGTLRCHSSALANSGSGNWASFPGGLVVSGTAAYSLNKSVALHSGTATGATGDLSEPNLNVATFRDPQNAILTGSLPSPPALPLAWIHVRQDGSLDTAQPPDKTNTANPIVGRFAYWTDDESSKVNYNLAWTRSGDNAAPPGHPTRVELAALEGFSGSDGPAYANGIHNAIVASGTYQFFNTPEDARRVDLDSPGAAAALQASKFDVTHYNHDPDTTFFNEPRIVLTTQPKLAGWTFNTNPAYPNQWVGVNGLPSSQWAIVDGRLSGGGRPVFLDIAELNSVGEPVSASGWNIWNPFEAVSGTNAISNAKLSRVLRVLNSYLRRTDWPMASGSSFQSRYYGGSAERLTQLSLNIVDYVRSKEYAGETVNNSGIVVPIRGSQTGTVTPATDTTNFAVQLNSSGTNTFLGIARIPKITEIGIWVDANPFPAPPSSTVPYSWTVKVELYLPPNFGLAQIDLRSLDLIIQYVHDASPGTVLGGGSQISVSEVPNGDPILRAGQYITITRPMSLKLRFTAGRPANAANRIVPMRFSLSIHDPSLSQPPRLEICPFQQALSDLLSVPFDDVSVGVTNINSLEVDDPRINSHKDDWKPHVGAGNSFGVVNSVSTLGAAPVGVIPQQDTDNGVTSAASLYMPSPWKVGANTAIGENPGFVTSAGELGFIHTGMESTKAGTPWRTLRLQPNSRPVSEVPDWAFMDLFTAPVGAARDADYAAKKYVYAPHDTAIAGRVNVNAKPEAFSMERVGPLAAALQGSPSESTNLAQRLTRSQARTIAENICRHALASQGKIYGNAGLYDSPGEIVEIAGVADGGEKSEELIRQISNNVTTRGNVFTAYSVGQAVKQLPSGKLQVLAEQRAQAMIERFSENGKIRFAPVYFRTLTP